MAKNTGHTGQRWFICALSGFEYPISEAVRQRGYLVGSRHVDEPGYQRDTDPPTVEFVERDFPEDFE